MVEAGIGAGKPGRVALARGRTRHFAAIALCLAAGACSQSGTGPIDLAAAPPISEPSEAPGKDAKGDLAKATSYWAKEYAKNPRDAQNAINYARNLKAMGEKRQALAVVQQATLFNADHRGLNSEYGRLALEFDQLTVAQKLLEHADDPTNPDWRVVSARGTVLAKQGSYRDAIPFYERALALSPNQASVLNNLALAHAMEGNADQAEPLLKRASTADGHDPRVTQNLALVLGLQGKYDEAKLVAARNLPADKADSNIDYVRRIVMLDPQPLGRFEQPPANVAKATTKRPNLKGPAADDPATGWAPQVAVAPTKQ